MPGDPRPYRTACLALLLGIGVAGAAYACNVPVFRFALERWRPDPYRVTVFHRGQLRETEQAQLAALEAGQEKSQLNLALRTIDVDEDLEAADQQLFAALEGVAL